MATSTYTAPSLATVQAFLANAPKGLPSDYAIEPNNVLSVQNTAATQSGTVLAVPLVPAASLANVLSGILAQPASASPAQIVCLWILNVPAPANRTTFLRVFIDHPSPTLNTSPDDPHYVRDLSFFCCGMQGMQMSFFLDVTPTLRRLIAVGEAPEKGFHVQVLAGAMRGAAPMIVPPLIRLAIASRSE